MKNDVEYSVANPGDILSIVKLVKECGLPYEDINQEKLKSFIVAKINNSIIGCIGIEIFNHDGLLRSLAVNNEYRNQEIGGELYRKLLSFSTKSGVTTLHLLTTTAENYFIKKGFIKTDRSNAPQTIKVTAEFSTLCSSSSTYMVLQN